MGKCPPAVKRLVTAVGQGGKRDIFFGLESATYQVSDFRGDGNPVTLGKAPDGLEQRPLQNYIDSRILGWHKFIKPKCNTSDVPNSTALDRFEILMNRDCVGNPRRG